MSIKIDQNHQMFYLVNNIKSKELNLKREIYFSVKKMILDNKFLIKKNNFET